MGRFELRTLRQPLLQQQGSGGTVQTSAAIARQPELFTGRPGAAVFIHPGQGQIEGGSQAQAVTLAMLRLGRGLARGIQRQTHHKPLHRPFTAVGPQNDQIRIKATTTQGSEGRDTDAQGIAAGQADAPPAHIEAED